MIPRIAPILSVALVLVHSLPVHSSIPEDTDVLGRVHLVVFNADDGTPVADVTVRVLDVVLGSTNPDGALDFELFGGLYHIVLDTGDGIERELALGVWPEQTVEVIASIYSDTDIVETAVERPSEETTSAAVEGDAPPLSAIRGRVVREETGEGVPDARIFVRGLPVEAKTDADGRFEVAVPAGVLDLVVVHSELGTVTRSGIEVPPDRPAEVIIEAAPTGVELEELTVTAPRIEGSAIDVLKERQASSQVSDIIGAEQMSKSGDTNAASALKRVTGVTIVGGKYVYVRGLGERYSSTRLNGLGLPSPDPERRVVPLDMFPAAILDSMVIQKTYSPDMPGEFGGGVVDLRTRGYPDDLTLKLALSTGMTTGTTFTKSDFSADRGPTDFLGIDGGHRALPKVVADATRDASLETGDRFHPGYSEEELSSFTRAMLKNWELEERRLPPDFKISITGGDGFKIKKTRLGFLASALYKNEWDSTDKTVGDYKISNTELVVNNRYRFQDTVNTITLGGILALGVDLPGENSIKANTVINRITDNAFWTYQGLNFDSNGRIRVYNYEWIERMILTQQVLGSHLLSERLGLKLDWRYGYSNARRNEPDKRFTRYDYLDDRVVWAVSSYPNGNGRDYLSVNDNAHDMGVDLSLPFVQWSKEKGLAKVGGAVLLKDRAVDTRRFQYGDIGKLSIPPRTAEPAGFYIDRNMSVNGMVLTEGTKPEDNYKGEHNVFAGYVLADLPLGLGFNASGGLRLEKSDQQVETFSLFDGGEPVRERIDELDLLPSFVLTYKFEPDMLVRLGYGRTVNRPDLREMSPGCAPSYAGGYDLCGIYEKAGNKLKRAVIHNVDLRWEWYPSEGESISFGGFYKEFLDPLESVVLAGSDKIKFVMNAEGARNFGLELDFRKSLEFIHKTVRDVYVAGNATWVFSRVRIPDITTVVQTNSERPLQGQSPFVVNFQLGYDNADTGTSAALLYNVFGKRISDVGTSGLPDVYEQPFHQLDLVVKQKVGSHFDIGFKAQNLIDGRVSFLQGKKVREQYRKGRYFSLSAGYSY